MFAPALTGGWIYDDHPLIEGNLYVHSFEWWPRWFVTDFWDIGDEFTRIGGRIAYWRPAVSATYALDWTLSGGSTTFFHLTNLLWHALVTALAFVTLRRWLDGAVWPAAMATLLFAIHPTKAESVAWIAGRTDVLCMAAVLLASHGAARRFRGLRGGILLEFAGTALAYTSKEQAIVLPIFIMVEAWVARSRPPLTVATLRTLIIAALPQAAIVIGYLSIRKLLLPIAPINLDGGALPLGMHSLVVLETFGRFAALAVWPHDLSIQHGLVRVVNREWVYEPGYIALGAAAIVAVITAIGLLRKRIPQVSVGLTLFAITIAPTSNIVNTQMKTLVSERFLYLPVIGLAFAAGALLARSSKRSSYALAGIAAAALAVQSFRRASDYSDENKFWERELALHPNSAEARRGRIRTAIAQRKYRDALLETLTLTRAATENEDLAAATDIAKLSAQLAPDHDRTTLESIDRFCTELLERRTDEAVLQTPLLVFRLRTKTKRFEHDLPSQQIALTELRANIRSRLGDDAVALELAQQNLSNCPRCPTTVTSAALVLARASRYADARAVLDHSRPHIAAGVVANVEAMIHKSQTEYERALTLRGPAQLQAQAAALAAVELWGRAYDVLSPYKEEIQRAPKFALGFAELAVRAGVPQVAREVLGASMTPLETDAHIIRWSRTMGWIE